MSDQDKSKKHTLTQTGRARRQFIGGTALAAAGTSAAMMMRGLPAVAADAPAAGSCASTDPHADEGRGRQSRLRHRWQQRHRPRHRARLRRMPA